MYKKMVWKVGLKRRMANKPFTKKTALIFFLLFLVFLSLNSKWLWQLMYPIKYNDIIYKYSRQFDIDPYLILSIIQVETRFDEKKISKKGAVGLMQIMPETAKWIIEKGNFPPQSLEYLSRPEVNIALGSWYLANINQQFQGNEIYTMAAYNAGPGNVKKWIEDGIWDGNAETIDQIPFGETRHYIQRVLHFYERYQWIYSFEFDT
ncbi:lytic transglycosylase domain-containing protein [Tepidibacillus sp. HK-1]|uniref:lytic transglycosylase domain-containing protein n=1 Tax=Tepidibacillus sp. HK-1 TaxID=1883407 RepID=UPI0008579C07|nr:lytic transglycosylase domain-containing protein [Tepidibacillus sp. HK-1]GBF11794.1 soluble lytic murein transglycosylase precursor [Tepidibacillus sp. HK-1]